MQSFEILAKAFEEKFSNRHFPEKPSSLYEPNEYFLKLGGKRVRPILCLMGTELFEEVDSKTWNVAFAIELFHNFTLIHDDIMDRAPLRRGMQTVHEKFGTNTALLSGDVMLIKAYDYLNLLDAKYLHPVLQVFNKTARQVCEGQQLDMDFEKLDFLHLEAYVNMIELKTSVLLAASLKMGAILGGASERNQNLLYEFGKKIGIAFQIQDDYLDAFGDSKKIGKQIGGDILSNKKTFLLIKAMEVATEKKKANLENLLKKETKSKVEDVLSIFKECKVDYWALELKNKYFDEALSYLEEIAVLSNRKIPLKELAQKLIQREF